MADLTTTESQATLPISGAVAPPRLPVRRGAGRPFKTPRPAMLSNARIMVDDLEILKGHAAQMGLPMSDFWAWAGYQSVGMPVPEYIQRQIDEAAAAAEQAAALEDKRAS